MKKTITTSAPGKLTLYGEHAVVYGYPCIVTAMDSRVRVSVSVVDEDHIDAPQVKRTDFVEEALRLFREKNKIKQSVEIATNSDFSSSVGLGSSSAVIVATIKALGELFAVSLSDKELFDMCYQVVINVKGIGSGFDIAAAVYGGTIYFDGKSKEVELLRLGHLPMVVGYTGNKADTATLVKEVRDRYEKEEKKYKLLLSSMADIVQDAYIASTTGDSEELGVLFNENHALLQKIGVSTDKLDSMVEAAKSAGAYGAKLSGAGGGDCMIALVPDDMRMSVERAIEEVDGKIVRVEPNAQGVRVES